MSYTEIYTFDKDGEALLYEEVQNAWRGAMAVWGIMEERYLPPYKPTFVPAFVPDDKVESYLGYKPTRTSAGFDENAMKPIWKLANDEKVSETDKIVLASTFDNVVVKKQHIPLVIEAFEKFEGNTSLKEQAEILKQMLDDENVIAVAWNQTSVNGGVWEMAKEVKEGEHEDWYEDEADEDGFCTVYVPYNLNVGDSHWFLFKDEE